MTIIKYPNEVLRKKTMPIVKITKDIFELAESMTLTMFENDGIGLAANQVGSHYNLFVVNIKPLDEKPDVIVALNPKIIKQEEIVDDEEGCLSFPGLFLHIPRFKRILLHYQNLYNEKVVIEADGITARAIQHEYDHLNGILFIDYVNEKEKAKVDEYLLNLKQV